MLHTFTLKYVYIIITLHLYIVPFWLSKIQHLFNIWQKKELTEESLCYKMWLMTFLFPADWSGYVQMPLIAIRPQPKMRASSMAWLDECSNQNIKMNHVSVHFQNGLHHDAVYFQNRKEAATWSWTCKEKVCHLKDPPDVTK